MKAASRGEPWFEMPDSTDPYGAMFASWVANVKTLLPFRHASQFI